MDPRRVLIVGTGALATLFAAKLASIGVNVTILGTWKDALLAFETNGAQIEGKAAFPVHTITDPIACDEFPYSLILVKSWQTKKVATQLCQCLMPDGLAISLQNGLGNLEVLSEILGFDRAFSGVTTLGASISSPGIVRLAGMGRIWLENNPRVLSMVEILREAGFHVEVVDDISSLRWEKLLINSAINPLTAILRVKNGELLSDPKAFMVMCRLIREAAAVARSSGIVLSYKDPEEAVIKVAEQTKDNQSSMLRDVLRNVPTEVDWINGVIVRLGQEKGIDVKVNALVMKLVKEKNRHSSAELSDMVRLIG